MVKLVFGLALGIPVFVGTMGEEMSGADLDVQEKIRIAKNNHLIFI